MSISDGLNLVLIWNLLYVVKWWKIHELWRKIDELW